MALGKTVQYTPFQETSFGYGSGEIAADQTQLSPTDIVKVRIGFNSGTHWDYITGHISTPSVGTAVSTFNKFNMEWIVRGEVADVDAVLAQLKFFPSDYEDTRTWTPTTWKDNQTTGNYGTLRGAGQEQPDLIPNTVMGLTVHDVNDSFLSGHTITWEAIGYDYDNNRPYFSVEPTVQDVSALGIPPLIDLGTIAHVPATDNVTVTCEFRNYNSTSPYTGTAYGSFTNQSRFYVADKKEGTRDTVSNRFNFTGSLVEAQAFLDNIGYNRPSTEQTFDMMLRVSDGVVGSEVTKTCWFSDYPFETTLPIPDLVGTEETTIVGLNVPENWDINHPAEVDNFWYTIQFDSVGTDGIESITEHGGYNSSGTLDSNGYFVSNPKGSPSVLKSSRLDDMELNFRDDFNDDFSFTIQFHGSNATLGTSYSSTPQTVNVTMADASEFSNLYTSHNFEEDHRYYFANGAGLPNIAHGYNVQYTARVTASDPNAVETMWTYVPTANYQHGVDFFWENGDQLRMVGTRDDVNAMLNGLYFEPATDYDQNFSFSYKQTRLGGDTTSDEAEGDYYNIEIGANNCISMTCAVSHDEYSFTPSTQDWSEDVSKTFDTGIRVTDLSDEHEWTTSYQTDYTVYMKMVDAAGNDYNVGSLTSTSTGGAQGNLGGSNPKTYTGTKAQVNQAIANMKYVPYQDVTTGFFIQFKIVRDFDGAVLADYDQTRQITFNTATGHDEYTMTLPTFDWNENAPFYFDSGLVITDLADENPDMATYLSGYQVTLVAKYSDGATSQPLTTATWSTTQAGSATVNGSGTVADPLTIAGDKSTVNTALANLKMLPNIDSLDWTHAPSADGSFWLEARIERLYDNVTTLNFSPFICGFNAGTDEYEFDGAWGGLTYTEDTREQYIFSGITAITETADQHYSGITYESTVTMSPDTVGGFWLGRYVDADYAESDYFENESNSITVSGTKAQVNLAIQNIQFNPNADTNDSFDILYTHKRYINGVLDVVNATNWNVGPVTAVPVEEVTMGTANSNIQYSISDTVDLTTNFVRSPRNLTTNQGKTYQRPFTITDSFVDEDGDSEYKVTFTNISGLTLYSNSTEIVNGILDFDTKANIHSAIDDGIRVVGLTADHTINFTVRRRTFGGIEKDIYSGSLNYVFLPDPEAYLELDGTYVNMSSITDIYAVSGEDITGYLNNTLWTPPTGFNIEQSIKSMSLGFNSPYYSGSTVTETTDSYQRDFRFIVTSAQTITTTLSVSTEWETVKSYPVNVNIFYNTDTHVLSYSPSTTNDMTRKKQSNYWDGTFMNLSQVAVNLNNTAPTAASTFTNKSDRFVVNKSSPAYYNAVSTDWWEEEAYDRALLNGSNNKFYSFYCSVDANNNRFLNTRVWSLSTPPFGTDVIDSSHSHQIMTNYAGDHWDVSVSQVIYDSVNEDTYLLILADNRPNEFATSTTLDPTYAIIVKMNWNGTSYTFTTVKTIQLLATNERYNVEAHLTDDFSRLITIQSEFDILSPYQTSTYDRTSFTGSNRIRVYDKDTGGVNNWGLTTTTSKTTRAESRLVGSRIQGQPLTRKITGYDDVNYGDINGSDTLITSFGYIFKKDEGGTDNWGEYDQLDITIGTEDDCSIVKYSQDVIVACSGTRRSGSYLPNVIVDSSYKFYDKTTFEGLSKENNSGIRSIELIEASRNHNIIGLWNLWSTSSHTFAVKLIQT